MLELQAATTTELKFEDSFLEPPLSSLILFLNRGPLSKYENLGCAALAGPLAVVVGKGVL